MNSNDQTPSPEPPATRSAVPSKATKEPRVECAEADPWIVYSDRLREVIHHENELVNHRIHWLVLLNGLAFAATGVLWGKENVFPILIALGVSGAACTFSCYLALQGGRDALEKVNRRWKDMLGLREEQPEIAPISARPKSTWGDDDHQKKQASRFLRVIRWPSSFWKDVVCWKAWENGAWIDNRLTRKLHPLNAIPVVIVLVWGVVVGNLCENQWNQRKTEAFPVKLTHRGLDIEIKEAEEGPPARGGAGDDPQPSPPGASPKPAPKEDKSEIKQDKDKVDEPPATGVNKEESTPGK